MLGGLALAFMAYAVLLAYFTGAYAGGSDSSGYLNNARLLREGRVHVERRAIEGLPPEKIAKYPYLYVPLGFVPMDQHEMVPTYPIGLSLLIVGVSHLTGWGYAPHVTMWLHALAGVGLMFALARVTGLSLCAAAMGALLLGLSPLYLFMALQAMSDVPALVWSAAAVLCAWLSRRHDRWALAAGASVAMGVLIRPTNLFVLVPVAVCLGLAWRRWIWLAVGGAPGAVFLALFNLALYGKALTTGYGDVGSAFSRDFVPLSLISYLRWLPVVLTPGVVLVFALPWVTAPTARRFAVVLALWMAVYAGFYTFYYHTHETWWYLRFLLPAFPPAILAMLFAARTIAARWPARRVAAATLLLACALLVWDVSWDRHFSALDAGEGEKVYPEAAHWARDHLPANTVIACMQTSGALRYYTDFILVRYDQFIENAALLATVERASAAAGRPIYAMLFPFEIKEKNALEGAMPGRWTQVGILREGQVTIWRRDGPPPAAAP